MRNLIRRIEALEKSTSALRQARQAMADQALETLSLQDLELLISAFGGDREGRALTQGESAARQAYGSALESQSQRNRLRWPTRLERIPNLDTIHTAIIIVLGRHCSDEELELAVAGSRAQQQGRTPTERELVALQATAAQGQRLCHRAGFQSEAELESVRCSSQGAPGANR